MRYKKQNLAIVTTWYPPVNGSFVQDQAEALTKHYNVHVFYFRFGFIPKETIAKEKEIIVHRIQFPFLPKKSSWTMRYWIKRGTNYVVSADQKYDFEIIHAHAYLAGFIAGEASQKLRKDFYVTLHNNNFFNFDYSQTVHKQLQKMLPAAKNIFVVGEKLKESIEDRYLPVKTVLLYNFVDTSLFKIEKKDFKHFNFVVIGDLNENKGIYELTEAFSAITDEYIVLHIIGKISDKRVHKLPENVVFHGYKSRLEVVDILKDMHCLISFSEQETFGITVIEAMACGLPILYCKSGGPEYLVPDYAGILIEREIKQLQDGIYKIIKNYDSFDSSKIRDYTIEKFDKDVIIERLIGYYEN